MLHKGTITLNTQRLLLRRFALADADAMFSNWANDPAVTKYLTWPPHGSLSVTRSILASWQPLYEQVDYYNWAIVLKELGEAVGSIAVVEQSESIRMVHMGFCLGQGWWHKGIMSEALTELIRFFFIDVTANRIESRHNPANPRSGQVMQKCGLQYEGRARQDGLDNQGLHDSMRYAILAEDYFRR
jgi:ribosomal-protein-alanine N-acetyltransferase